MRWLQQQCGRSASGCGSRPGRRSGARDGGGDACPAPLAAGYGPCRKGNVIIPKGGTYLTPSGCQACTCNADGGTTCKDRSCTLSCNDQVYVYNESVLNTQNCTTDADCTGRRYFGLRCPCPIPVNPQYASDAGPDAARDPTIDKLHCDRCNVAFTCAACPTIVGAHCQNDFCVPEYAP